MTSCEICNDSRVVLAANVSPAPNGDIVDWSYPTILDCPKCITPICVCGHDLPAHPAGGRCSATDVNQPCTCSYYELFDEKDFNDD